MTTRFSEAWYATRIGRFNRRFDRALEAVVKAGEAGIIPRAKPQPKGEPIFPAMCVAAGYPRPRAEFAFHPTRKWQFDFAFPDKKIAIEVEGGIWRKGGGAHSHPLNIERDIEKYNAAALLGWRILRYAPEDLALAILDLRGLFNG